MEDSLLSVSTSSLAPRRHRTHRMLLIIVLVMLLLVIGGAVVYVAFLSHSFVVNVKHEALLPSSTGSGTSPAVGMPNTSPSAGLPSGEDSSGKDSAGNGALNILLIGSDGKTSVANGRSDVIILVHISGDRKKVYLVHFPRDMYVDVPGHGKDKINAAYAYGGPQLLVRTLQDLVGVALDHVAVIGFEGFRAMTDAVGGVDVYAEEASNDQFGDVHVGMNHLDGEAALGFVRERYELSRGDLSRGRRQQAFVKALMLKMLSKQTLANPVRFAALVRAVSRNLTLDNAFSMRDIYSEASSMRNLRSGDFVFITAPITGFGRSPQGASIDIVDYAKMAELSAALKADSMDSLSFSH